MKSDTSVFVVVVAPVFSFIPKSLLPKEGPKNLYTDQCRFLKILKDAAVGGQ